MSRLDGLTRRDALLATLAGSALLPAAARAQAPSDHHHVAPTRTRTGIAGAAEPPTREAIDQALAARVGRLQGFDPGAYITAFDHGKATKLPGGRTLREYEIVAEDKILEIAPGIFFPAWTYNGSVPGPTIRCVEGDRLRITFVNRSESDHTIHFHGIHAANMDGVDEVVKPNARYVYEFDAEPYGLQFYHCHVPPVHLHMNRGLYGAFIIDPERRRRPAKELVMIAAGWDVNFDERNEIYTLNGPANFFRDNPIRLQVNELTRIYFINALEFDPINSLHLHGNFFTVYRQTLRGREISEYTDVITLSQAERRIVEFSYRHPGRFMFHAHQNVFAERGWMGHFEVLP